MVDIKDNFLTKDEFKQAWEKVSKFNFPDVEEGKFNRHSINIDFLKKKLATYPNSDLFTYVTKMDNKSNPSQEWHVDISGKLAMEPGRKWTGFALQFIIYMGGNFKGGNLHIKEENLEHIIEPIENRLIILNPFKSKHKVDPLTGVRYTLNGFIYTYTFFNQ